MKAMYVMKQYNQFFIFLCALSTACLIGKIMPKPNNVHVFSGIEARKYMQDIANIRITSFKEYPYLYQGTIAYEKEYLETYFTSYQASILLVFDDDNKVVGFSNSIPLIDESEEIKNPFIVQEYDIKNYLYIGEVMLYPAYRGKGILRQFFTFHEEKARELGLTHITFMTVDRPDDHPLKPKDYQPYDTVWRHFGYEKIENVRAHLAWVQVDTKKETKNTLIFWQKNIINPQ